jgi:hypothetical protein
MPLFSPNDWIVPLLPPRMILFVLSFILASEPPTMALCLEFTTLLFCEFRKINKKERERKKRVEQKVLLSSGMLGKQKKRTRDGC